LTTPEAAPAARAHSNAHSAVAGLLHLGLDT